MKRESASARYFFAGRIRGTVFMSSKVPYVRSEGSCRSEKTARGCSEGSRIVAPRASYKASRPKRATDVPDAQSIYTNSTKVGTPLTCDAAAPRHCCQQKSRAENRSEPPGVA